MSLEKVVEALRAGQPSPKVSVREFLEWFDVKRRGYWKVREIRDNLAAANLVTKPDFEWEWIDAPIEFAWRNPAPGEEKSNETGNISQEGIEVAGINDADDKVSVWVTREAAYRISRLDAANKELTFCAPDDSATSVITTMLRRGYSQLPVMTGERSVKGVVSWQSIGSRLALGSEAKLANQLMENHHEISSDKSLFDAIQTIVTFDYVLVKDATGRYSGIITAADLSLQFRELTEPFLLLSEIENILRNLIGQNFEISELRSVCDDADQERKDQIKSAADLTFGEYLRLLEHPDRWEKIGIQVDRRQFCADLDRVRQIRNDVMHFDPEGIDPDDLSLLREFTRFLQQLSKITKSFSA